VKGHRDIVKKLLILGPCNTAISCLAWLRDVLLR